MKIIGQTDGGLLISATKNEIANLLGFYYTGSQSCPELVAGLEIRVSDMYGQLSALNSNKKELSQLANKLRSVADLLELNDPLYRKLAAVPEEKA